MNTVFDHFPSTPYTFLEINRGTVEGNVIEDTFDAEGVFKDRSGMTSVNNQESKQSDSTLHIRTDEEFLSAIGLVVADDLVGHGIRRGGVDYEIVGATGAFNFETNELEAYRVTLQTSDFVEEETS